MSKSGCFGQLLSLVFVQSSQQKLSQCVSEESVGVPSDVSDLQQLGHRAPAMAAGLRAGVALLHGCSGLGWVAARAGKLLCPGLTRCSPILLHC